MSLRTLVLVRHSDAEHYAASDRQRDLTGTGRLRAQHLGALLETRIQKADLALVSDALRARRTLEKIREYLPVAQMQVERSLYTADAPQLIDMAVESDARTLLIVGHEPTISETGYFIGDDSAKEELRRGVRTATALIIEIPDASRPLIGAELSVETLCAPTRL